MSVYVKQNGSVSSFNSGDTWVIMNSFEQSIKSKIEKYGVPLKDWDISINYGIKTGFNPAFIINGEKKDELISDDPRSAEIIRPILRGKDIRRYGYDFADLWLIATFPSKNYNIDDYPAVKKHLLSFDIRRLEQTGKTYKINEHEKISARKKTNNKWFETQDSISYWDDFSKQKILYRQVGIEMDACLVNGAFYANDKCYMITGKNLPYILCFLNSKLFSKIIFKQANVTGGKGRVFLNDISLPQLSDYKEWGILCNEMCENPEDYSLNSMIDDMIYTLFHLTEEEREYMKNL